MERTYAAWAEAFTIFAKYGQKEHADVSAEHDIIHAGPNPEEVTVRDIKRLEELRWFPDDECECFYHFV